MKEGERNNKIAIIYSSTGHRLTLHFHWVPVSVPSQYRAIILTRCHWYHSNVLNHSTVHDWTNVSIASPPFIMCFIPFVLSSSRPWHCKKSKGRFENTESFKYKWKQCWKIYHQASGLISIALGFVQVRYASPLSLQIKLFSLQL